MDATETGEDQLARDAVAAAAPEGAGGAPRRSFRRDVEGLRAIAVLAVLAYHAGIPGAAGGYVGVDVFFVLSGFLITSLLVEERASTGTVSLVRFYARRARRLLPAATAVVLVTLAAAAVVGGSIDLHGTGADGRAVSVFGVNLRFAAQETGYFSPHSLPSAFQHFWSLAVEEQFYFAWPALTLAACAGVAGDVAVRRRLRNLLLVVVPLSFGLCVVLTSSSQPDAFFLLPARAWELGLGALLAVAPLRLRSRASLPVSLLGAALVLAAITGFDETTSFPGWAAAVPVVGTAMLLVAGAADGGSPLVRLLSSGPLQPIGKYSYALYLWHWPVLVVAAMAKPRVLQDWPKGLLVVAASVPVAIVSFHLLEDPIRRSVVLARSARRSLALGLACVLAGLLASSAAVELPRFDAGRPALAAGMASAYVPEGLRPPLLEARDDGSPIHSDDEVCDTDRATPEDRPCSYGDPASATSVVLAGDSHAGMWFVPTLELAEERGWHLEVDVTGGCTILDYDFDRRCDVWRDAVVDRLVEERPDVVVLVDYARGSIDRGVDLEGWRDALASTLEQLDESHVVLLGETPRPTSEGDRCVARHLEDVRPCEPDPEDPVFRSYLEAGREEAEAAGASFVDLTPLLCWDDRCPVVVGDRLVYFDENHVTQTYVQSVDEQFTALLEEAIDP